ncbi:gram-negative bacteria-binding protein 2 [Stomoxys calcitrans]|uniref:Uncharacterized protein n=1 Tax=Stomoxys calcitrans TaxID=35570 RepID=A0A1I8Q261_STOCA|nr:gram-negative bacteria-binding protein 2 [Stomoxys calcitrans]
MLPLLVFKSIIFAVVPLILTTCSAYEIPSVKVDVLRSGFNLTIADEPGIKKVLYIVRINGECPGFMDLIDKSQPDWTASHLATELKDKDMLDISILVDHNGEAYKTFQNLIVGTNNNQGIIKRNLPRKCYGNNSLNIDCKPSQTLVADKLEICKDQLIFEENFDGPTINAEKWSFDIRNLVTGRQTDEFVVYDNHGDNIFLNEGSLHIKPTFTQEELRKASIDFGSRCTPVENVVTECKLMAKPPRIYVPPVNSSQIHTRETFRFKYARIEIKAKLPKGDWLLPYIMIQNNAPFDRKQMRIAFARGNEQLTVANDLKDIGGRLLYGGIVKNLEEHNTYFKEYYGISHFGNGFHVYTLTWTNEAISMAVDGLMYGQIFDNIDEYFFITLGVSAGGHLEFPDNLVNPNVKPWKNTSPKAVKSFWQSIENGTIAWNEESRHMIIDYVRVYAV